MRTTLCPVCNQVIDSEVITSSEPFECPHGGHLLTVVRRPAQAGFWIVMARDLAFHRRFTFLGLLGAMFLVPFALTLLNFALNRLLGYGLHPVDPAGGTKSWNLRVERGGLIERSDALHRYPPK